MAITCRKCRNCPCARCICPVFPHVIVDIASRFPENHRVRGLDSVAQTVAHAMASLLRHNPNHRKVYPCNGTSRHPDRLSTRLDGCSTGLARYRTIVELFGILRRVERELLS